MLYSSIRTFMSANSAYGFKSFFDSLLTGDGYTYIIKGGPGTGKSGFMRKTASKVLGEAAFIEYIYCSSDPDSLDAVSIYINNTVSFPLILVDGTAPHIIDPVLPGVRSSIVDLGSFWDADALKRESDDIKNLSKRISDEYAHAYRWLSAAGALKGDISKTASCFIDNKKIYRFTENLIQKTIKPRNGTGLLKKRFLTGITPHGVVTFYDTLYSMCKKVLVLKDPFFTAHAVLSRFCDAALKAGHEVYAFYSPLSPEELSHVAIPALELAVSTQNAFVRTEPVGIQRVGASRFFTDDATYYIKRLSFSLRIMKLCINEAVSALASAKSIHDDLEDIYIRAMDFTAVDKLNGEFTEKLLHH